MRNLVLALFTISLGTLWFFNFSAGIIGGIWLLLTGGLSLVLMGLLFSIIMPFAWTIAFLPSLLFAPLLTKLQEGGNRFLLSILGFIVSGYQYFLLTFWVTLVFGWLFSYSDFSPAALFLWGYAVVMGPLSYMYRKEEPDAHGSTLGILFAQLACLTLLVSLLISGDINSGYEWIWLLLLVFTSIVVFIVNLYVPTKTREEQPTIFTKKEKIAHDIATVLLVCYQVIKRGRPNLEGEKLYEAVLQSWNLNLSKGIRIEISEIIEKAKRGSGRHTWGEGINLRRITYAIALDEFIKFCSSQDNPNNELTEADDEYWIKWDRQLKKDYLFISKMEDEIERIIPEGV